MFNRLKTVLCAACLVTPSAALADVVWSANAMGCVPTPLTLAKGLIDVRAGRVIFVPGKTGIANLICPIGTVSETLTDFATRSLFLTYRDGDGNTADSGGEVRASFRRINKATSHVETLSNGAVSSHAPGAPNSGAQGFATHQSATAGNTISETFKFGQFYYYVHLTMKCERTCGPLALQGAFLQN